MLFRSGGNPLVTAAASVVLETLLETDLLDEVKAVSSYLKEQLEELVNAFEIVKEVRGMGLMLGLELTVPALAIEKKCMANGMLVVGAGEKVIRFVPPLVITKAHVDEAIQILKESLTDYLQAEQ